MCIVPGLLLSKSASFWSNIYISAILLVIRFGIKDVDLLHFLLQNKLL